MVWRRSGEMERRDGAGSGRTTPAIPRLHFRRRPDGASFDFRIHWSSDSALRVRVVDRSNPRRRGSVPWLVFSLALLHLLFWTSQCVGTNNDSTTYLEGVEGLQSGKPSYFPPGYPALLGLLGFFGGANLGGWTTLVQHGMAVLGAVWLYMLLRRVMREDLALLGALLGAFVAPSLTTSQGVMSETVTCCAMIGSLFFTVRCAETEKMPFAVLAGILAAFAVTLRVVPVAGLTPALCMILYPVKNGRRKIALTLTIMVAIVSLPVLWFWYRSGDPRLADSTGFHLFNRVILEQKLLDEEGPATRRLRALLGRQDPRDLFSWQVNDHIQPGQLDDEDIEPLLRQVSIEGIRKNPVKFLAYTPGLAWRLFIADPSGWIPAWGGTVEVSPPLETPPLVPLTASSLAWRRNLEDINRNLWPIFCWSAIAGLVLGFLSQQRLLIVGLAWTVIGYLLLSAVVETFAARYNVPIIPFVIGLAMIPVDLVWTKLRDGIPGRMFQVFETEAISDAVQ
jgi:hypothetical protein